MAEHTRGCPRPWELSAPYNSGDWRIRTLTHSGSGDGLIAHLYFDPGNDRDMEKANAEFIVRACNAHEDLLAACEAALKYEEVLLTEFASIPDDSPLVLGRAEVKQFLGVTRMQLTNQTNMYRAAIAKAKGGG